MHCSTSTKRAMPAHVFSLNATRVQHASLEQSCFCAAKTLPYCWAAGGTAHGLSPHCRHPRRSAPATAAATT